VDCYLNGRGQECAIRLFLFEVSYLPVHTIQLALLSLKHIILELSHIWSTRYTKFWRRLSL